MFSLPIRPVRVKRPGPVFVCRKCLKKADAGGKFVKTLKRDLRRLTAARGSKKPRVIVTSCFGLCPKGGIVLASAVTLADRGMILARPDAPSEGLADQLLNPAAPDGTEGLEHAR